MPRGRHDRGDGEGEGEGEGEEVLLPLVVVAEEKEVSLARGDDVLPEVLVELVSSPPLVVVVVSPLVVVVVFSPVVVGETRAMRRAVSGQRRHCWG